MVEKLLDANRKLMLEVRLLSVRGDLSFQIFRENGDTAAQKVLDVWLKMHLF